jgi:anti-sigma-K factor RskA
MRCGEARRALAAGGAGEGSAALAAHLAGCEGCRREQRAYRNLLSALAQDPARQVGSDFERRLQTRLATQPARSAARAWWERLSFGLSWRLRPALGAAAALAAAVATWALVPTGQPPLPPQVQEYVAQHNALVQLDAQRQASAEDEVVDYSIAQSVRGSAFETN